MFPRKYSPHFQISTFAIVDISWQSFAIGQLAKMQDHKMAKIAN